MAGYKGGGFFGITTIVQEAVTSYLGHNVVISKSPSTIPTIRLPKLLLGKALAPSAGKVRPKTRIKTSEHRKGGNEGGYWGRGWPAVILRPRTLKSG